MGRRSESPALLRFFITSIHSLQRRTSIMERGPLNSHEDEEQGHRPIQSISTRLDLARNKFFRRGAPTPTNLAEALMASVWIGYRVPGNADFLKKREFRWVDGSPNDFRNWIPSKAAKSVPYLAKQSDKRQSENCAVMSLDSSFPGMWTRIACNDEERIVGGAVCQIRLSVSAVLLSAVVFWNFF